MQRSPSIIILRIHIPASSQVLFDHLDVSGSSSFMNIDTRTTPHQHHDCDCCDQIFHGRGFCNAQTSAFQAVLTVAGKCGQPKPFESSAVFFEYLAFLFVSKLKV